MLLALVGASATTAHEDRCAAVAGSVAAAGFEGSVAVTCTDTHAVVRSDTHPDHELTAGITGTDEQASVPAVCAAPILLRPVFGTTPLTHDHTVGGEMAEADLAHHQARHDSVQTGQLDVCGGHAGRGDDHHYRAAPVCMIERMANAGPGATVGWAFDGFPIHGDDNPDGSAIPEGDLDVCDGQADDTFGHRCHTSEEAPRIVQCLMGEVPDFDRLPHARPLSAVGGGAAGPDRPPEGGVEGLVLTEDAEGLRSMDYIYHGEGSFIRHAPSEMAGCHEFTARTVANGGELPSGKCFR